MAQERNTHVLWRRVIASALAAALLGTLVACAPAAGFAGGAGTTATPRPSRTAPTNLTPATTAPPTPTALPTPSAPAPEVPVVAPPEPPPPASFDRAARSVDDPTSLWVVANKVRPLNPVDWVPPDLATVPVAYQNQQPLRLEAGNALVAMFAAAASEGAGGMQMQSAYRSYDRQVSVYAGWVSRLGQAQADAQSARPGYSEHQTGLAVDISPIPLSCALDACFGSTPQGIWLAENAWRFGFLLRYPADKVDVTGYTFEPWHFRYIGVELSTEMHTAAVSTLEEFFGLPAAPGYIG
ncbi:M15 family metallopeptidase [Glaciihabitans tibetensis]|uniref:M15 family metallopeptidase n=1 Tax=Glaciihabitans tibetensis TaxID=1266600 RepID=UPI001FE954B4|nr:M15 family metallopeptidase [Glaciihabitans tibetensis]